MGCGPSVEMFDKSAYTSLPGTPQPERRLDKNKNAIENDKTLRGDVIQKQYARKTREEKLREMDRVRSAAAKEFSDKVSLERERFSISSRYGSRATSQTTSRTESPSIYRITPSGMANGYHTPQRDDVRLAGPIKKLSDLNEAALENSVDMRRRTSDLTAKQGDGSAIVEAVPTNPNGEVSIAQPMEKRRISVTVRRRDNGSSVLEDKENINGISLGNDNSEVTVENGKEVGGKKGGSTKMKGGKDPPVMKKNRGDSDVTCSPGERQGDGVAGVDSHKDTFAEKIDADNIHPNGIGANKSTDDVNVVTKSECNDVSEGDICEKPVKKKRKKSVGKDAAQNGASDESEASSVNYQKVYQNKTVEAAARAKPIETNVPQPESDVDTQNVNNSASSDIELSNDLEIGDGGDLDLTAPSFPSFPMRRPSIGNKKGKLFKGHKKSTKTVKIS